MDELGQKNPVWDSLLRCSKNQNMKSKSLIDKVYAMCITCFKPIEGDCYANQYRNL